MTRWTGRPVAQRTWNHATTYFGDKVRAIENHHAAGGQSNTYASANAATEMKNAVATALEEIRTDSRETALAAEEAKQVHDKIDTLKEAVALLAKTVASRAESTPPKRRRNRRQ